MLDNNDYSWTIRGDPVKMSRKLSAVVSILIVPNSISELEVCFLH